MMQHTYSHNTTFKLYAHFDTPVHKMKIKDRKGAAGAAIKNRAL
jgi:hypothetical protein